MAPLAKATPIIIERKITYRQAVTLRLNVDLAIRRGLQGGSEIGTCAIFSRRLASGFGKLLNPVLKRKPFSGGPDAPFIYDSSNSVIVTLLRDCALAYNFFLLVW